MAATNAANKIKKKQQRRQLSNLDGLKLVLNDDNVGNEDVLTGGHITSTTSSAMQMQQQDSRSTSRQQVQPTILLQTTMSSNNNASTSTSAFPTINETNEMEMDHDHFHHENDTHEHLNRDDEIIETELPNEMSSAYASMTNSYNHNHSNTNDHDTSINSRSNNMNYTELMSTTSTLEAIPSHHDFAWGMNYHEAAIYLQEGLNNDKFDYHPRSKDALPAYLVTHHHLFYILNWIAAMLLLSLALIEKPALDGFKVHEGIHASLELLALSIVGVELSMKFRWMGIKHFFRHKRTAIKSATLVIMIFEALVVLIRHDSHFRVTRSLRPVFLIDNHYCGGIRRVIRQILQSMPPIIDMLVLLFFFMLIFAILGFYLFSPSGDIYFETLEKSFISLFVLLTTANYPDVMMPSYSKNRLASLFFIAFLVVHLYFLMNLMLAVVYETFTRIEKDKFRKLYIHRRRACKHAFRLLVTKSTPTRISFKHFEGLMKYYKPSASKLDTYLMFKTLDVDKSGYLSLSEFYKVFEVAELSWERKHADTPWYVDVGSRCFMIMCQTIHDLVAHKWFNVFIYVMIASSGLWQVIEAVVKNNMSAAKEMKLIETSPITLLFVTIYGIEASLKVIGFGVYNYFKSGWNIFDFIITILAIIGLIGEGFGVPFSFVFVLRSLRLLRLFELKARYRDIMGTFLFIIMKRFGSVSIVVLIVYYFFAILGMELFARFDMKNCCKNTSVEQYFVFPNTSLSSDGFYYLNNFNNIAISYVTLFQLMVVNNWFILMDAYSFVYSEWSRLYFMIFYIVTMVVITIVVAFVLEAFLFRIQYQAQTGDIDKDTMVIVDVPLSQEELSFCYNETPRVVTNITHLLRLSDDLTHVQTNNRFSSVIFHGSRTRTKFSFSSKMYAEEIKEWTAKADEEDRKRRSMALREEDDIESIMMARSQRHYSCSY